MGFRSGQVSLEYMIITGFIVFAILIPSFLILFHYTTRGVGDSVSAQKTIDLGKGLINDAKQMYYLGIYSKKIAVYEIPDNVMSLAILKITKDSKDYYYIFIQSGNDQGVQTFQSDVPLTSTLTNDVIIDNDLGIMVPECSQYPCEFYSFIGNSVDEGQKRFKIETEWTDGVVAVNILPVLA